MRRRRQSGFTLVEIAVAALILSLLMGVSILALRQLKQRGSYASATGDVLGGLRLARAESFGRGQTTYFIIDTNVAADANGNPISPRWWVLEDVGGDFNFTAWDPSNPTGLGDLLLANGIFPTGVTVNAASAYPKQLATPYALIPATSPAPAATPAYCSFCTTGGAHPGFGWVRFSAGSPPNATFPAGTTSSAFGQQLTIMFTNGTKTFMMVVAILARSGAVTSQEQIL
jgi:prepilin-type N-terminal cleavage/methylation domain-containing protein